MPPTLREREPTSVEIDGEQVEVRVRESPRARTARLRVGPQHPLELIVPAEMTATETEAVLAERRPWIKDKLAASRAIARKRELGLDRADVVWLAGEPIPVELTGNARAVAHLVKLGTNGRGPERALEVGGEGEATTRAIARWYMREARRRIRAVAEEEAERLRLEFAALVVRDQRTRWGSCSRAGNLAFNWRLTIAPPEVLRYVVVHELLHLREPNHSKRFWRALDNAMPGWRSCAAWLREHGAELRAHRL